MKKTKNKSQTDENCELILDMLLGVFLAIYSTFFVPLIGGNSHFPQNK